MHFLHIVGTIRIAVLADKISASFGAYTKFMGLFEADLALDPDVFLSSATVGFAAVKAWPVFFFI